MNLDTEILMIRITMKVPSRSYVYSPSESDKKYITIADLMYKYECRPTNVDDVIHPAFGFGLDCWWIIDQKWWSEFKTKLIKIRS